MVTFGMPLGHLRIRAGLQGTDPVTRGLQLASHPTDLLEREGLEVESVASGQSLT